MKNLKTSKLQIKTKKLQQNKKLKNKHTIEIGHFLKNMSDFDSVLN